MELNKMKLVVPYNYIPEQFSNHEKFFDLWKPVLQSGEFTLGPFVENFENKFASYIGSKFCIAVNNGTDALILSLKAAGIGPGDEIITPSNSFYATTGAIVAVGAIPVFSDVDSRYQIEISGMKTLITKKTKAILPVHWAGASPDMLQIIEFARQQDLLVIEDACMAIGGKLHGKSPGTFGDLGAYSMHPLKTLNVAGDGGMVVTNNEALYLWMKKFRNHGMTNRNEIEFWGVNMRIQPLQAVIANYFLDYVDGFVRIRNRNASYLDNLLNDLERYLQIPNRLNHNLETFSLYMILASDRDNLIKYLIHHGVEAKIHYPTPLHLQPAAQKLGLNKQALPVAEKQARELLTIPIHQYLKFSQLDYVSQLIHTFYQNESR
ncbi:MAG: DegT/DnrJ/EryC1/StrS family aminotransferase [Actinobacteria bacterium]|nr:DegT/DnrJ/EryC1/StrS family aminotransferase [Actinomycetota bacterium]